VGFYRERIFPRLLEWTAADRDLNALRRQALAPARGRVLEIGIGTGINLEHYPPGVTSVCAIDPNPGMTALARERAARFRPDIDHRQARAEDMPFDDASFDCVLSTLTLCSIPNVTAALAEVRRVLKPEGQFLFLEHGRHPQGRIARWQDRLDGLWGCVFDGCHINRDIGGLVEGAGFHLTAVDHPRLERAPALVGYCYLGRARPAAGEQTASAAPH
jgi:SAM-dependent methyltransferase